MKCDLVPIRRPFLLVAALAVVVCGLLPAVAAAAPPVASPTSLTFGQQTVGSTSSAQTVLVSNPDPGVVQIVGLSVLGTDPGDFSIGGENCAGATLDQAEACLVEVSFAPQAGGPRSATLELALEGEPALDVALAGTGQSRQLTVPGSASFQTTSVGGATTTQIPLKNESEAGVNVSEVSFEGVDPGDFGIEGNNCLGYIGVGMGCELTVRFSPGASGTREARLRVATDGIPSEYLTVLSGEGVPPEVSFEPGGHDFGLVEVHSGGPRSSFTVRNAGAASVQLTNLQISGPDANEFWIPNSDCWGTTLAPGATCSVEVQFNANEEGSFSAAVQVSAGAQSFDAPLTARAARPRVTPSSSPLVFGPTSVGSVRTQVVTLTNSGELPVAFYIAVVSGGDVSSFHLLEESCTSNVFSAHPRIFEPGESCAATIAFEPRGVGAKAATVSIFGAGEGALQLSVEGTATAAQMSLTPGARDFGAVVMGDAGPVQTFELRNESPDPYTVDAATLAGADVGEFQVRSDACTEAVLEPGDSCAVAVRFDPESSGPKAAALRLRGAGGVSVARLAGEGVAPVPMAAVRAAATGRVLVSFSRRPADAGGNRVAIGRARCVAEEACTAVVSGHLGGRWIAPRKVRLAAGSSSALSVKLPARFGAGAGVLGVTVRWRAGTHRGGASHSFRVG